MLNVNDGHNLELMEHCRTLKEYAKYVARVRKYVTQNIPLEEAVTRAVDECIEEGILAEFLMKNKAEVIKVVTKGLYKAQMTVEVKDASGKNHQVNVLMTFNGDDCTISSGSDGVQVSGSGKFVKKDQLMGEFKRNTLYLNYNIKSDALGTQSWYWIPDFHS